MSQDLLIAFDEPESPRQNPPKPTSLGKQAAWHEPPDSKPHASGTSPLGFEPFESKQSGDTNTDHAGDNEDDDFGDFEDASPPSAPTPQAAATTSTLATVRAETPSSYPRKASQSAPKSRPSPKAETRSPFPAKTSKPSPKSVVSPRPAASQRNNVGSHPFAGHMDLLFANDDDDEYDAGADEMGDLANNPEAAMAFSKRVIAEQQQSDSSGLGKGKAAEGQKGGFIDLEEAKTQNVGKKLEKVKDPNVLFDAEDESDGDDAGGDDDDFGDFETWDQAAAGTQHSKRSEADPPAAALNLLGLDDVPVRQSASGGTTEQHTSSRIAQSNASEKRPHEVARATQQDDDFWNDFGPSTSASKEPQPRRVSQSEDTWQDFEASTPSAVRPHPSKPPKPVPKDPPETNRLPPTNIPPPVVLLSLFPPLFASADDALFAAMSKLDLKSRTMLLSHPASHQFLRGYLNHMTVLARIIAGRKLRWKRDQRLSQSMRIGPAGGRSGGMKLTGLDKAEVAKEDREVVDTIRLYRAQVGKLRSAVSAASSAPGLPKLPAVPDLTETMPTKALKQAEGGITAREACALCGLRREERVVKVDHGVEDSFDEWWVQGMNMHLACKSFWDHHERKLKSR